MRRYLDLFRLADVKALLASAFIARLPFGINILALILLLRAEDFSYAHVGIVTGALGLAVGATVPLLRRLTDRAGQTRVLVATSVATLVANVALALRVLGAPGWCRWPRWRSSPAGPNAATRRRGGLGLRRGSRACGARPPRSGACARG
jgi:MFS family permease